MHGNGSYKMCNKEYESYVWTSVDQTINKMLKLNTKKLYINRKLSYAEVVKKSRSLICGYTTNSIKNKTEEKGPNSPKVENTQ